MNECTAPAAYRGVAIATSGAEGLQWLGAAWAFRLSDFPAPDWTLLDLIRVAWPGAPDDALEHRDVLAIDAPLDSRELSLN